MKKRNLIAAGIITVLLLTGCQSGAGSTTTENNQTSAVQEQQVTSTQPEAYNQIKIRFENQKSGAREIFIAKDSTHINQWGLLQYTDSVELSASGVAKAEALLKLYNAKTRTLSISDALGDTRVRAGSSVIVKLGLGDINVQSYLLVEQVTHKFKQGEHLMDMKLRGGTFIA